MPQDALPTAASGGFAPYVFRERYTWIEAREDSDLSGVAIEARTNLVHGELKQFLEDIAAIEEERERATERHRDAFEAIRQERNELSKTKTEEEVGEGKSRLATPEERRKIIELNAKMQSIVNEVDEMNEQLDRKTWAIVSPYIRNWNVWVPVGEDKYEPVPPPSVDSEAAYNAINPAMLAWIILTVAVAYKSGKGLNLPSTNQNGTVPQKPERKTGKQKARST